MKEFLLIARKKEIHLISLDADKNVDIILPIKGVKYAVGIEYDIEKEKVYWADVGTGSINRAFLNGSGKLLISFEISISVFTILCRWHILTSLVSLFLEM